MIEVPLTPWQRQQTAGARVSSYGSAMTLQADGPPPAKQPLGFVPPPTPPRIDPRCDGCAELGVPCADHARA